MNLIWVAFGRLSYVLKEQQKNLPKSQNISTILVLYHDEEKSKQINSESQKE